MGGRSNGQGFLAGAGGLVGGCGGALSATTDRPGNQPIRSAEKGSFAPVRGRGSSKCHVLVLVKCDDLLRAFLSAIIREPASRNGKAIIIISAICIRSAVADDSLAQNTHP